MLCLPNQQSYVSRRVIGLLSVLGVWLVLFGQPASAHETRDVAGYRVVAGWEEEPALAGFKNAVSLRVTSGGRGVEGLHLSVEVLYGDKGASLRTAPMELAAAFGDPGHYLASIIPTEPGRYTFHVTGQLGDQFLDHYFTSGESTFNEVVEPTDLQFPTRPGEPGPNSDRIAIRSARAMTEAKRAANAVEISQMLAAAATGVAVLGLLIAIIALRRSTKRA